METTTVAAASEGNSTTIKEDLTNEVAGETTLIQTTTFSTTEGVFNTTIDDLLNSSTPFMSFEGFRNPMLRGALPSFNITDDNPMLMARSMPIPFGVLQNQNGEKVRKRCQCIEKKVNNQVVNVTFVPLNPVISLPGSRRNFTCNCTHLKKRIRTTTLSSISRRPNSL